MAQQPEHDLVAEKSQTVTEKSQKKVSSTPLTAQRFAEVVSNMNRFVSRLSAGAPFKEANIGLAEWCMLNSLAAGGASNKKLVRDLGITKQRVNQIAESLKKSSYVSVTQGTGQEKNVLVLTAEGRNELDIVNERLMPILVKGLQDKGGRVVEMAGKSLKKLLRVVAEPKGPDVKADKAGAKARKAEEKAKKAEAKKQRSANLDARS